MTNWLQETKAIGFCYISEPNISHWGSEWPKTYDDNNIISNGSGKRVEKLFIGALKKEEKEKKEEEDNQCKLKEAKIHLYTFTAL